jgi:hypothetical protein
MPERHNPRPIAVVTACMNANGSPEFAITTVSVTQDELDNGVHYYLVEADLLEAGYEEPFVHFDETESPPFLHAAVRRHLALSSNTTTNPSEKCACPV